jgi:hypothetical protein
MPSRRTGLLRINSSVVAIRLPMAENAAASRDFAARTPVAVPEDVERDRR